MLCATIIYVVERIPHNIVTARQTALEVKPESKETNLAELEKLIEEANKKDNSEHIHPTIEDIMNVYDDLGGN